jgi:hypothetical protein
MLRSPLSSLQYPETKSLIGVPRLAPAEAAQFVDQRIHIVHQDIVHGLHHIMSDLPQNLVHAIDKKRRPIFDQNAVLLHHSNINVHDIGHQDRDAYMALRIGQAFPEKIDPEKLEAVVAAAMIHDIAYQPAARKFALKGIRSIEMGSHESCPYKAARRRSRENIERFLDELDMLEMGELDEVNAIWSEPNGFPAGIDKKALDPHAPLGMAEIQKWYTDADTRDVFNRWDRGQKETAALAIRDHSNGSEYNTFKTPIEAKLLRMVDKWDNTNLRVPDQMLNEKTESDRYKFHRYVPAAILEESIIIDKPGKKITVHYKVDPRRVQELMRKYEPGFPYNQHIFLADFELAYRRSMEIAAEVVCSLFAKGEELYDEKAQLEVKFTFADTGTSLTIPYKRYSPPEYFSEREAA